ncbi:MAG: hypothetical protein MJ233_04125 [Mycoplasmoidaceae bacterium]|nr:hypothetical protein [Mycoplasmoidaceae bacterium]
MSLYATISNSTGSFEPVFDDGSSIKLLTTTPGSKNVNVGIKIPDSATPLDLQSASFSITFSAKDGDTEV